LLAHTVASTLAIMREKTYRCVASRSKPLPLYDGSHRAAGFTAD
jgi:CDGSH-type Zn-finger protein